MRRENENENENENEPMTHWQYQPADLVSSALYSYGPGGLCIFSRSYRDLDRDSALSGVSSCVRSSRGMDQRVETSTGKQ